MGTRDSRTQELIERIKGLEAELAREIQEKESKFLYKIQGKRVVFQEEVRKGHRALATKIRRYLRDAQILNILTAPIIWACLPPALLMDAAVSVYHAVCFPVYGIPKVRRGDYIVIDREALGYLNGIEKINCMYCGYFNGLMAYLQEIAARTEQYWCPIKHARRIATLHSRYGRFFEYGDAESYKKDLERTREAFEDLR